LCNIFPSLVLSEIVLFFGLTVSGSGVISGNELTALKCELHIPRVLAASSSLMLGSASSSDTGNLPMSSCRCLVNAVSPPDLGADQVADGDSDGFGSVGVETFGDELV